MSTLTTVESGAVDRPFRNIASLAAHPDRPREFRRGQVWIVAFGATVGHELRKTRPAVVISADLYNKNVRNRIAVVVPLKARTLEKVVRYDQVAIMAPEGGLWKDSVTVTNQIRSVSTDRLIKQLGELRESTMDVIDGNLAIVLDLG